MPGDELEDSDMTKKSMVAVMGSPRRNGNSSTLAEQVIEGAEACGAKVHRFHLNDMNIRPCQACGKCQVRSSLNCAIEDDMQQLYPLLRKADALVIASPIYWFTVSAQTKLFMDRCYALGGPQGHALTGKKIGIVVTYGGADPFDSGATNALRTFQDAFGYLDAPIIGMVYGSASKAGEIEKNNTLMQEAYKLGERLASASEEE
jgi:multimeric flavodoxin WrbA